MTRKKYDSALIINTNFFDAASTNTRNSWTRSCCTRSLWPLTGCLYVRSCPFATESPSNHTRNLVPGHTHKKQTNNAERCSRERCFRPRFSIAIQKPWPAILLCRTEAVSIAADMADYSSVAPPSSNAGGGMNDAFKDALQRARQVKPNSNNSFRDRFAFALQIFLIYIILFAERSRHAKLG